MNFRRHFVLIFTAVGVVLVFLQRLIFHRLVPYERVGPILQPAVPITTPRLYAAQLVGPALLLLAIATGLWLALGTPAPKWTVKRWPWAIAAYYLLHLPLAYLPGFPLRVSTLFVRWTFLIYFGLSLLGFACAVWILSARLHLAFPAIVLLPVLFLHFARQVPLSFRFGFTSLPTVLVLALAGWWLKDAADGFDPSASAAD